MNAIKKTFMKTLILLLLIFILCTILSNSTYSQDLNDPLEPDTVWIGKGKAFGISDGSFPISVEVFNDWNLGSILLPLRVQEVSAFANLDSVSFIDRLASDTILEWQVWDLEWVDWVSPDSFFVWSHVLSGSCLPSGSGKIVNLWFTADSTGLFVIDTCRFGPYLYDGLSFGDCGPDWEWVPVFVSDTVEIRECGDVNQDDEVTIADAVYLVNYVFKSGPEPKPILLLGDVNENNNIDIVDIVFLINYLFRDDLAPCCF